MKIEIENRTELPEYKVFKVVSDIYESEWRRNSIENERKKKGSFAHFGFRIDDKPLGVFFFPEREITKIVVGSATIFPYTEPEEYCGMAEPMGENFTTGKPGDYAGMMQGRIDYLEAENKKLTEENHKLKEAKKVLLLQLKTVCANYGTDYYCRWYKKGWCKGMNSFTCTVFNTIKKYDREEGENV